MILHRKILKIDMKKEDKKNVAKAEARTEKCKSDKEQTGKNTEGQAPQNEQDNKENTEEQDKESKALNEKIKALEAENEALKKKVDSEKSDYLRLMAEFETFRRRTAEEKLQIVGSAAAETIKGLLPVLDDCERAIEMLKDSSDQAAKDGTGLIYTKLMAYLKTKGLEPIKAKDEKFDTDFHEAVAKVPVEDKDKKNLIYDVIETGYLLNGKVLRYAKVVVGV